MTSPDGVNWTTQNSAGADPLYSILWTGSEYLAAGYGGDVLTSPDLTNWTTRASGYIVEGYLYGTARCGSQIIGVGSSGTIVRIQ